MNICKHCGYDYTEETQLVDEGSGGMSGHIWYISVFTCPSCGESLIR